MEKTFKVCRKQMDRFNAWVKELNPPCPYDEDCAGMSFFEWHFRQSGLGDTVYVTCDGEKTPFGRASIDLTLDDDGEFLHGTHEEY